MLIFQLLLPLYIQCIKVHNCEPYVSQACDTRLLEVSQIFDTISQK